MADLTRVYQMNWSQTTRLNGEWNPGSIISKSSRLEQPCVIGSNPDPIAETRVWSLLIILDKRVAQDGVAFSVDDDEERFDESRDTNSVDGLKDSAFQSVHGEDDIFLLGVFLVWLATMLFTRQHAGRDNLSRLFMVPSIEQSLFKLFSEEWMCKFDRLISFNTLQWFATASSPYKSC